MLVAWSVTEVIRYSYFVMNLRGWVPGFVAWLRYSLIFDIGSDGQWSAGRIAMLTVVYRQVQHLLLPVSVRDLQRNVVDLHCYRAGEDVEGAVCVPA